MEVLLKNIFFSWNINFLVSREHDGEDLNSIGFYPKKFIRVYKAFLLLPFSFLTYRVALKFSLKCYKFLNPVGQERENLIFFYRNPSFDVNLCVRWVENVHEHIKRRREHYNWMNFPFYFFLISYFCHICIQYISVVQFGDEELIFLELHVHDSAQAFFKLIFAYDAKHDWIDAAINHLLYMFIMRIELSEMCLVLF